MEEIRFDSIQINKKSYETSIEISYRTDLNSERSIYISVSSEGINLAATGSLNEEGRKALNNAIKLAEIIKIYGYP